MKNLALVLALGLAACGGAPRPATSSAAPLETEATESKESKSADDDGAADESGGGAPDDLGPEPEAEVPADAPMPVSVPPVAPKAEKASRRAPKAPPPPKPAPTENRADPCEGGE